MVLGTTGGISSHFSNITAITPKKDEKVEKGHVCVTVRVRPFNKEEKTSDEKGVIRVVDDNILVFDPHDKDYDETKVRRWFEFGSRRCKDAKYAFDRVFRSDANTRTVFEHTTRSLLDSLLDGYNCSVFAYGATGAGKTFTMLGNDSEPGVIILTAQELYNKITAMKQDVTAEVSVTYLEIYNEHIRDLLRPSGDLQIRDDGQCGITVAGLSSHTPRNAEELCDMLRLGNNRRTQHPTDANAESSRSHAVLQVRVRVKDRKGDLKQDVREGKMCLVDLAGSERAQESTNSGARMREGANINRSLLALGNCINALTDTKKTGYVPYRDSKLTRLLKDSLGGNCKTVMIAAVSPSVHSYEDTFNTLQYANRAKNIMASLQRNVVSVDFHVSRYAHICKELQAQVDELKAQLANASAPPTKAVCSPFRQELQRIRGVFKQVFEQRVDLRRKCLELESGARGLDYRIRHKERRLARVAMLHLEPHLGRECSTQVRRSIDTARKTKSELMARQGELTRNMEANTTWLKTVQVEVDRLAEVDRRPEVLDLTLRSHHLEVELRDTRKHVRYLKKLCKLQEKDIESNESLVSSLLLLAGRQQKALQSKGLLEDKLAVDYHNITKMVIEGRAVTFSETGVATTTTAGLKLDFPVMSNVVLSPATPKYSLSTLTEETPVAVVLPSPLSRPPDASSTASSVGAVTTASRTKTLAQVKPSIHRPPVPAWPSPCLSSQGSVTSLLPVGDTTFVVDQDQVEKTQMPQVVVDATKTRIIRREPLSAAQQPAQNAARMTSPSLLGDTRSLRKEQKLSATVTKQFPPSFEETRKSPPKQKTRRSIDFAEFETKKSPKRKSPERVREIQKPIECRSPLQTIDNYMHKINRPALEMSETRGSKLPTWQSGGQGLPGLSKPLRRQRSMSHNGHDVPPKQSLRKQQSESQMRPSYMQMTAAAKQREMARKRVVSDSTQSGGWNLGGKVDAPQRVPVHHNQGYDGIYQHNVYGRRYFSLKKSFRPLRAASVEPLRKTTFF